MVDRATNRGRSRDQRTVGPVAVDYPTRNGFTHTSIFELKQLWRHRLDYHDIGIVSDLSGMKFQKSL